MGFGIAVVGTAEMIMVVGTLPALNIVCSLGSIVTQNGINFGRLANVHNQFFLIQKFCYFKHKLATKYRNWFSYILFRHGRFHRGEW